MLKAALSGANWWRNQKRSCANESGKVSSRPVRATSRVRGSSFAPTAASPRLRRRSSSCSGVSSAMSLEMSDIGLRPAFVPGGEPRTQLLRRETFNLRQQLGHALGVHALGLLLHDRDGQLPHGRRVEQRAEREVNAEVVVEAGDELSGEERVAAEVEEVVVDADLVDVENLLPRGGQPLFRLVPWGRVRGGQVRARVATAAPAQPRQLFQNATLGDGAPLLDEVPEVARRHGHARRAQGPREESAEDLRAFVRQDGFAQVLLPGALRLFARPFL